MTKCWFHIKTSYLVAFNKNLIIRCMASIYYIEAVQINIPKTITQYQTLRMWKLPRIGRSIFRRRCGICIIFFHLQPALQQTARLTAQQSSVSLIHTRQQLECWQLTCQFPTGQVDCLEQLRSPQLRFQKEQPTDVGVDWKPTILYTKASCHYLKSESICSYCSPKIGCHGNVPYTLNLSYVFIG